MLPADGYVDCQTGSTQVKTSSGHPIPLLCPRPRNSCGMPCSKLSLRKTACGTTGWIGRASTASAQIGEAATSPFLSSWAKMSCHQSWSSHPDNSHRGGIRRRNIQRQARYQSRRPRLHLAAQRALPIGRKPWFNALGTSSLRQHATPAMVMPVAYRVPLSRCMRTLSHETIRGDPHFPKLTSLDASRSCKSGRRHCKTAVRRRVMAQSE